MKTLILICGLLSVTSARAEDALSNKYDMWAFIKETISVEIFFTKSLFFVVFFEIEWQGL